MNFLKRYLKYIISAVVLVAVLLSVGIYNVGSANNLAKKSVSYTKTDFDYMWTTPTVEQIATAKNDSSVAEIYPYRLEQGVFPTSKATQSVLMFVTTNEYKDNSDIGFFSEKTLVKGSLKGGMVIDKKAAEVLHLSVGDTAVFFWGGRQISQKVVGMIHAVSYEQFTNGVVQAEYTSEMQSLFDIASKGFKGAFVKANDLSACSLLLHGFVGQNVFNVNAKQDMYDTYVKYKAEALQKDIDSINLALAICVPILFSILGGIFLFTSKKDDELARDDGREKKKLFVERFLSCGLGNVVGALIAFAVLMPIAVGTGFLAETLPSVLCASLPSLATAVVLLVLAFLYVGKLYKSEL